MSLLLERGGHSPGWPSKSWSGADNHSRRSSVKDEILGKKATGQRGPQSAKNVDLHKRGTEGGKGINHMEEKREAKMSWQGEELWGRLFPKSCWKRTA